MAASATMLFTWNVELVLLSLVCLSVSSAPRDVFLSASLLVGGVLSGVAHLVILSLALPAGHREVSVATLALNLGLVLAALLGTPPSADPVRAAIVAALACVLLLVSLGMVFASASERTLLVLHHPVLAGVLWPVVLYAFCGHAWVQWAVLACSAVSAGLFALRLVRASLWVNTVLGALALAAGAILGAPTPALAALAAVAACLAVWTGLAVWDRTLVADARGAEEASLPFSAPPALPVPVPSAPPSSAPPLPSAPPLGAPIELNTDVFQFLDLRPGLRLKPREKFS